MMANHESAAAGADVLVFGSGAAGLAAAVTAAHAGCSVMVFEKAASLGGTTAKSGGVYWIPDNHLMRRAGVADDLDRALHYIARATAPNDFDANHQHLGLNAAEFAFHEAYCHGAAATIEWFESIGALHSTLELALRFPDYHTEYAEQGGVFGRALCPMNENGEVANGAELISQLATAAVNLGVQIHSEHAFEDFVLEGERIVGARIRRTDGSRHVYAAHRAVVLATGGFTHNAALRQAHLPAKVWGGCAAPGNAGDVIGPLQKVGIPLRDMDCAWWDQVAIEHTFDGTSETRAGMWVAPGDSSIVVDLAGRRVGNEKQFYNDRALKHLTSSASDVQVLLFDERTNTLFAEESFAYPLAPPGEPRSHIIEAPTWPELIDRIDARLRELGEKVDHARLDPQFGQTLASTLERFNSLARTGTDSDYGRGGEPIEHFFTGAPRQGGGPNPVMAPLSESGPYYAILIGLGTLDTKGGPATNTHGQVLGADGQIVEGLYAVGNCAALPSRQGYWAAGATIGPALFLGHAAGRHIGDERAQEPNVRPEAVTA